MLIRPKENTVKVRTQNNYGRRLVYPVNSLADKLTQLTGKKTLTDRSLALIKEIGFQVEAIAPIV